MIPEIKRIADGLEPSGLTRAAYAAMHGITVAALDGYRRRVRKQNGGFLEIAVAGEPSRESFAIVLANVWRIEIGWADIEVAASRASHRLAVIEALDGQQRCSD